jgi:hypothetical protein
VLTDTFNRTLAAGVRLDSITKDGSAMTLTRLRGRSHFGAAKARPRQGGATLSHRMGEGLGVRAQFRCGWYFQVAPGIGGARDIGGSVVNCLLAICRS